MTAMIFHMELFGPRRGQTFSVGNHHFVDGHYDMVADSADAAFALKRLSFYAAYARGTSEYEIAMAAEKEVQSDGSNEVYSPKGSGETDPIYDPIRQDGAKPSEEDATDSSGYVSSDPRGSGLSADRYRHEDSRVPKFEESKNVRQPTEPKAEVNDKLVAAVYKLDPNEDSNWVATGKHAGKPKLGAVEEIFGRAGLARSDIEAIAPEYNRETALAKQSQSDYVDI